MKKSVIWVNALLILAILVGDVFFILNSSVLVKSLTSLGFVLLGAVNLFFAFKTETLNKKFCIIMLIGLVFAMLGDIVLEFQFIIGAALFAIGHVFYFVSYCTIIPFKWTDLVIGGTIFLAVALFIIFAPIFDFGGLLMEIVCLVYALIISLMVGKSITNYIKEKNVLNLIILIGSCLFIFSDFMLLLRIFANLSAIIRIMCLASYYPAQIFLACSILKTKN